MYDVQIPESLYERARTAAQSERISVEEFIAEAVQHRLQGEALTLSPSRLAKVRAPQEDVKAGRVFTPEQAKANLEAHRNEWLARNRDVNCMQ